MGIRISLILSILLLSLSACSPEFDSPPEDRPATQKPAVPPTTPLALTTSNELEVAYAVYQAITNIGAENAFGDVIVVRSTPIDFNDATPIVTVDCTNYPETTIIQGTKTLWKNYDTSLGFSSLGDSYYVEFDDCIDATLIPANGRRTKTLTADYDRTEQLLCIPQCTNSYEVRYEHFGFVDAYDNGIILQDIEITPDTRTENLVGTTFHNYIEHNGSYYNSIVRDYSITSIDNSTLATVSGTTIATIDIIVNSARGRVSVTGQYSDDADFWAGGNFSAGLQATMNISGANGSSITMTINSATVTLVTDSNGDGTPDGAPNIIAWQDF